MSNEISDRAFLLIEMAGLKKLADLGGNYPRWSNIKRGKARLGAEEIEILGVAYPEFVYWLVTGKTMPEVGQISPEDEEIRDELKPTGTDTN